MHEADRKAGAAGLDEQITETRQLLHELKTGATPR
jgi:hypothetical protein